MATIDWDEALVQVGNDTDFLKEVLQDLMNECHEASNDIASGISMNNFTIIMKAAHKIKGSASYLCCENLKNSSLKLQDVAKEGTTNASEDNMIICRGLYSQWQEHLSSLKDEIKSRNM